MEAVKNIQSHWLTFLKKGYDENGVAQYLHLDDPLVEKAREQLRVMYSDFDEQECYEGQLKVVSDHNAVVEYIERLKTELGEKALRISKKEQENQEKAAFLAKQELELAKQKQEIESKKKELESKSLETAKRLLQTDLNNEFIALATGLSEEEVEKLRKEI